MGWLSELFSSDKTVRKAVNLVDDSVRGVGNWIDELSFTEQEKAQANQKLLDFRLKVLDKTADESSVRSISRRILAWAIVGVFLTLIMLSAIGTILGLSWAKGVFMIAKSIYEAFLAVISFYFVSHIGNSWIEKSKK